MWTAGQVSVGVVEHAMFWDLPPSGTTDVVCNRSLHHGATGAWEGRRVGSRLAGISRVDGRAPVVGLLRERKAGEVV